jgi:hypothetical protein
MRIEEGLKEIHPLASFIRFGLDPPAKQKEERIRDMNDSVGGPLAVLAGGGEERRLEPVLSLVFCHKKILRLNLSFFLPGNKFRVDCQRLNS